MSVTFGPQKKMLRVWSTFVTWYSSVGRPTMTAESAMIVAAPRHAIPQRDARK